MRLWCVFVLFNFKTIFAFVSSWRKPIHKTVNYISPKEIMKSPHFIQEYGKVFDKLFAEFDAEIDLAGVARYLVKASSVGFIVPPVYVARFASFLETKKFKEAEPLAISQTLRSLSLYNSEEPCNILFVHEMVKILNDSKKQFNAQHLSDSIYGLHELSSNHEEVRNLIKALTKKIKNCTDKGFNSQEVYDVLYGMQRMNCKRGAVRSMIAALNTKFECCTEPLVLHIVTEALEKLTGLNDTDCTEVMDMQQILKDKSDSELF